MSQKNKLKMPVKKLAKVPVVMQMEALECGAACLTMILEFYGKWIPLEEVRSACDVIRNGSNAKNILLAARNYGLTATAYRFEPEILKEEGEFPCIIHWNFNHFVVLNGFKGEKASINDPGRGEVLISMKEFDQSFTGICLMFEPGENFQPGGRKKSVLSFVKKRLHGAGVAVAFTAITMIISSLISLIAPGFSRIFYDRLLTGLDLEWAGPFILFFSIFTLVQILVELITAVYSLRIAGKLGAYGSSSFMWKVLHLPMTFFEQRMTGDILMRESENASIAATLVNTIAPLILHTGMMFFYLVIMIRYSPLLTVFGILSIAINLAVNQLTIKKRINFNRVQERDMGKLAGTTTAGIEMIETIQAAGAENGFFERWAGYQASVKGAAARYDSMNQVMTLIADLAVTLCNSMILLVGVFLTMKGNFTIGMIYAFQGFLGLFSAPAQSLIDAGETIQQMRIQMERVEDVMQCEDDPGTKELPVQENAEYVKLGGTVEMKHVTFGYSRLSEPLIEDFSMSLKPGSSVAFVGSSGCGKSTLSKLISGLVQPWSGEILFDGKKKEEIDRSVFTGSLAVVDQEITLFNDSIGDNIRMWDNSIEDFEVIMAARDAHIHELIMHRQGGYKYRVQEGGKDFSGGERQRIEIARVLAQDPTILILDEATSALDARTEYEVVKSIRDRGITSIVIAHRLSTIRDCDEIIVMDHGKVVERGTHEQLYAMGGYYTQLISNE